MCRDWAGFQRMKKISLKPQWIAPAFDNLENLQRESSYSAVPHCCYIDGRETSSIPPAPRQRLAYRQHPPSPSYLATCQPTITSEILMHSDLQTTK